MKKILVVDWLEKYGGAERVLKSLSEIYDFDKCYTLINLMSPNDLKRIFGDKNIKIVESNLKYFKSKFRYLFFLFPYFISELTYRNEKALIISSSFSVAKGFKKKRNQLHICYYQARNQRYIWDKEDIYFSKIQKIILKPVLHLLRKVDIIQSKRPDHIIANSFFVKKWIKDKYNIDSTVIYPPVNTSLFKLNKIKESYFITVARLEPYKRVDLLIRAFNTVSDVLYVVGDGSVKNKLKKTANNNIRFFDFLKPEEVMSLVSKASGFLHAGIEDFGIAPVEALSCGTPVIAFNKGGVSESVIDQKTGVLFNSQSVDAILNALKRFKEIKFDYEYISAYAEKFSEENFQNKIKQFINSKIK